VIRDPHIREIVEDPVRYRPLNMSKGGTREIMIIDHGRNSSKSMVRVAPGTLD
jgi:hypothetical protein